MKQEANTMTLGKQTKETGRPVILLTMTGLFAAMITIMTAYICHIPSGINGGYIHFGDALIYLCAALLPQPYALAAAAIGGGMADLLTAPMWVPATLIIKTLLTLPFTNKGEKILCRRNVIAVFAAFAITGFGYFCAERILFGTVSALIASVTGNIIQSGGSAVFFFAIAAAFDRAHIKVKFNETLRRGQA